MTCDLLPADPNGLVRALAGARAKLIADVESEKATATTARWIAGHPVQVAWLFGVALDGPGPRSGPVRGRAPPPDERPAGPAFGHPAAAADEDEEEDKDEDAGPRPEDERMLDLVRDTLTRPEFEAWLDSVEASARALNRTFHGRPPYRPADPAALPAAAAPLAADVARLLAGGPPRGRADLDLADAILALAVPKAPAYGGPLDLVCLRAVLAAAPPSAEALIRLGTPAFARAAHDAERARPPP
jgi:hypothetical protein